MEDNLSIHLQQTGEVHRTSTRQIPLRLRYSRSAKNGAMSEKKVTIYFTIFLFGI